MKRESGREVWRDGRNQGGAASTLVTAVEILSSGGKGGMTLPGRKCVGGGGEGNWGRREIKMTGKMSKTSV